MKNNEINWAVVQPLAGGMPLGYQQVFGTMPKFIINNSVPNNDEYINYVNNTLKANVPVINMDFNLTEFITPEDEALFNEVNTDIQVVCFVPVCSGLCMLSTAKNRGDENNEANQNMYILSNFIMDKIKPKVAVMENAPTLYSKSGSGVLNRLREISRNKMYSMTIERVDSYDHGIPQHRQRTFVYYWADACAPLLEYEKKPTPNLIEYFSEISTDAPDQNVYPQGKYNNQDITYECIQELFNADGKIKSIVDVFLSVINEHRNTSGLNLLHRYDEFESAIKWSEKKLALATTPEDIKKYERAVKKFTHCQTKIRSGKGYWDSSLSIPTHRSYINALIGKIIGTLTHPYENRALNLREMTKLMGHPDDYLLTKPANYCMLTQNVTVQSSAHTAFNCIKFVNDELKNSDGNFVMQNNIKQRIDLSEYYI